jgi:hypothetical protein
MSVTAGDRGSSDPRRAERDCIVTAAAKNAVEPAFFWPEKSGCARSLPGTTLWLVTGKNTGNLAFYRPGSEPDLA